MKKHLIILSQIILMITFLSCGKAQTEHKFGEITAEELSQKMAADTAIMIIDVRTPGEFNNELGHVQGSALLPLQEIEKWSLELEGQKDAPIYLVCRSGNRSGVAAGYLAGKGFTDVYNMVGGLKAWNRAGLEVARDAGK